MCQGYDLIQVVAKTPNFCSECMEINGWKRCDSTV